MRFFVAYLLQILSTDTCVASRTGNSLVWCMVSLATSKFLSQHVPTPRSGNNFRCWRRNIHRIWSWWRALEHCFLKDNFCFLHPLAPVINLQLVMIAFFVEFCIYLFIFLKNLDTFYCIYFRLDNPENKNQYLRIYYYYYYYDQIQRK